MKAAGQLREGRGARLDRAPGAANPACLCTALGSVAIVPTQLGIGGRGRALAAFARSSGPTAASTSARRLGPERARDPGELSLRQCPSAGPALSSEVSPILVSCPSSEARTRRLDFAVRN